MALSKPAEVSVSALIKKANTERKNAALGSLARMNIDFTHLVAPRVATSNTVAGFVGSNKLALGSLCVCIPVVRGEGRPENALRLLLLQRTYARSTEETIDTETSVGILMTHLAISGGVDFSNADVKNHLLKSSIQVETVEIGAPELPMMGELVTGTATLKSYAGEVEACKKQLAVLEHKEEEEGDDDRKLEITEEIRTISEVAEKFERFHNLVKTGATKEEQKMEWFTMMSMLIVSDAKASRSTENYRQYIQRRLGAFLAVTLTGARYLPAPPAFGRCPINASV